MGDPREKKFRLKADELRPLATGYGGCYASDMITVDGHRVGYMHRQEPDFGGDGGWRFFSGLESDGYMGIADNFAIYDVNTIANYDPDIIPHLDAPIGSEFLRDPTSGNLVEAPPPEG